MNKLLGTIYLSAIFAGILSEVTARPQDHTIRIVHGTRAADGEFPYLVQLLDKHDYFYCGGSIIGDKWILTAAHCVIDKKGGKVAYGTNVLYEVKHVNTTKKIKNIYTHPQYALHYTPEENIPYFDVGILELEDAIPFDAKAQPVKLADASAQVPFHQNGILAGWGVIDPTGFYITFLQKINLLLLDDTECGQKIDDYAAEKVFNSTHNLCSDDHRNGQCFGDSGSPFVVDGIQYGLVSWSYKPCGVTAGAYSRLTTPAYRDFIKNVTGI